MVKIFDVDLVKGHFIVTDNGKRALVDTGCPFIINDENKYSIPKGEQYLDDVRRNVDSTINEFRGLEYFAQRKVLFDYKKAAVVVADKGDEVDPVHRVQCRHRRGESQADLRFGSLYRELPHRNHCKNRHSLRHSRGFPPPKGEIHRRAVFAHHGHWRQNSGDPLRRPARGH